MVSFELDKELRKIFFVLSRAWFLSLEGHHVLYFPLQKMLLLLPLP